MTAQEQERLENRRRVEEIVARLLGNNVLRGWRATSLRTTARWIREGLASSVVEAELEQDMRDLADDLDELAGLRRAR